jgi:small subunit ribosomal protein S4
MSRYIGPRVKKMRALGIELPGLSRKKTERRPYPPGQHGQGRRKLTEYGVRLIEKQKLHFNYGVTERQLRRLVAEALASKAATGDKLLELLERRLDNTVFRSGFAPTIPSARQLVCHGHILVNGKRVDIPSYRIQQGDEITLKDKAKENAHVKEALAQTSLQRPTWVEFDESKLTAKVQGLPDETSVPFPIDVKMVVEFYSQAL